MKLPTLVFAVSCVGLWICGCQSTPPPPVASQLQEGALSFVRDGQLTLDEAVLRLGVPTDHFEVDRILTYRIAYHRKDGVVLLAPRPIFAGDLMDLDWQEGQYSLVLVFDARGVLKGHSILPLKSL